MLEPKYTGSNRQRRAKKRAATMIVRTKMSRKMWKLITRLIALPKLMQLWIVATKQTL